MWPKLIQRPSPWSFPRQRSESVSVAGELSRRPSKPEVVRGRFWQTHEEMKFTTIRWVDPLFAESDLLAPTVGRQLYRAYAQGGDLIRGVPGRPTHVLLSYAN